MLGLLFSLGHNRYAIDCQTVIEVLPNVELTRVPHSPEFVAGQFDFRGAIVPVIDLRRLVEGKPCERLLSTRIMITMYCGINDTDLVGLMAEKVTEVRELDHEDGLQPPVATPDAPYLGPILAGDQQMIQFVKVETLLTREVQNILFVNKG